MEKMMKNKKVIALFLLPGLLVFTIVFLIPAILTIGYSLTEWNGINEMTFVGLDNYLKMFTDDPIFWIGVRNTLILLVLCLVGQIPLALVLALILDKLKFGVRFFKVAFFIPVLLSTAAIALLWQKVYEPNFGIINQFVQIFNKQWSQEWLSNDQTVIFAVAVPVIWQYVGYHMVILYAGIKSIPEQFYEAALIDGANKLKAVWYVTIPLLRDIIKVCVVLCAVGSLKLFDLIYIMTKGGPFNSSSTVAIQMYNEAFLKMSYGYGSAVSIFMVLECLTVAYIINKIFEKEEVQY